ncbi:hypothetical protein VYU27_007465 [Nannochloropsis oceanica]
MQADGEDDDSELTALLEQALLSTSDSNAGQALGQVVQARLTDVRAVPSIVARLWHTFFAGNKDDDASMRESESKVLHFIGWDLFEALVPWARGGDDCSSSSSDAMDSSSASPFSSTSSSPSPFLIPLLSAILGLHSGRERLLMLQEALALAPRRTHPSFVPWLVAQMPPALAVIPAPRRKSFLDSICRVWREEAVKALAAMEEGEDGEREEEEEEEKGDVEEEEDGKGKERRLTGKEAQAILMSVLEAVEALVPRIVTRRGQMMEEESVEDAAAAVVEMGYVIGVLLALLLMAPPLPPPPPPSSALGKVHMHQPSNSFCFAERVTAVLARALTCTHLVSFETLLRHHRGLKEQRRTIPHTHYVQSGARNTSINETDEYNDNITDEKDGVSRERKRFTAIEVGPLIPASAVASTPFAWEPAGLSLAAYHLFIHPPSLPVSLLPRVLASAYVGQLLAVPAAFLLQKPQAAPCGLALLERGTLASFPSQGGERGRVKRGGEGVLECRALGGGSSRSDRNEGGKEEGGATEDREEEDTWASLIKGLTGCMVFLADDTIRQRAYLALPRVLALLTYRSRYFCLAAALPRSHHPTIQALLISQAQKTLLLATTPTTSTPSSFPPSPWHDLTRLRVFYAPVLSRTCAAKPEVLVSWAAATTTSRSSSGGGAATGTEGQLDALLSALNFLRFLRLKGRFEEGGEEEGEWWPKLRELQGRVREILSKPHQQRNAFRLAMVDEVLAILLGKDGEGKEDKKEGTGMREVAV